MSKRIYVGNLPWSVTKEQFDKLFSPFGDIEDSLVVADKYTGRSRGFGFVTFKDDASADKAISEMDGKDVEGRNILVKEARPLREEGEPKQEAAEESVEKKPEGKEDPEKVEEKEAKPKKKPKEEKVEEKE